MTTTAGPEAAGARTGSCVEDLAAGCAGAATGPTADLSLLVVRAGHGLRCRLDRACRDEGLSDGRDWLILSALSDGTPRTQLELARLLGIDKTTLTAVLDRLQRQGMVVRRADPQDRRARIPEATQDGRRAFEAVARVHAEVEQSVLGDVPADVQAQLRQLLVRLAGAGDLPAGDLPAGDLPAGAGC